MIQKLISVVSFLIHFVATQNRKARSLSVSKRAFVVEKSATYEKKLKGVNSFSRTKVRGNKGSNVG